MEIPNSQHPGLISKSQTEEKARFATAISKILPVVNLIKKMYGSSRLTKLIKTNYGTYKLTQSPLVIFDNIKINHPLVKFLSDYVKKLDSCGDSCKFFLMLVGNLIEESLKVLEKGVKASAITEILYETVEEIPKLVESKEYELVTQGQIIDTVLRDVVSALLKESKIRELVVKCVLETKSFSPEKIRVCKIPSGSLDDSYVLNGMIFEREPEGLIKSAKNCTTAIYNTPLDIPRGELKSTIQMESANQLSAFSKDEILSIKKKVESLSADVVVVSGKVNEVFLDFLDRANKLVFKIMSKHDLRRIRELMGGVISQECMDIPDNQKGRISEVSLISEGSKKYTKFISNNNSVCSIVIKHPLECKLDEIERNINKTLLAIQKNTKNGKIQLCEGAGAFERRLMEAFDKLSKETLQKYNEGEDTLDKFLVFECISLGFKGFDTIKESKGFDLCATKTKAVCYALEFVATMFEIEDYLVGIPPKLNVRPQMNEHWDEDH